MDGLDKSDEDFFLEGCYRVQSRRESARSALEGTWYSGAPGLLDAERVNSALCAHPQWLGTAEVVLRPALIRRRSGKFASEPDILYKREFFTPSEGKPAMVVDIVDVLKSKAKWENRWGHAAPLFAGEQYAGLAKFLSDIEVVIANEYFLHEAGHFLGYDVLAKYHDGYFSLGGRTAWPLIYLEELRADLQAFGFALQILPEVDAAQIFLYNIALRFGVQREGLALGGVEPYGLVPYLLFCVLRELEFLHVVEEGGHHLLSLASLKVPEIVEIMRRCAAHAQRELTEPELCGDDPVDRALLAARYVRRRMDDRAATKAYDRVLNQILNH